MQSNSPTGALLDGGPGQLNLQALPTASAELSRRVEKVVGYPPLCDLSVAQRREFHEARLDADTFEGLPGKWQGSDPQGGGKPAGPASDQK